MKSVFLYSPYSEGHHEVYATLYTQAMLKLGHKVVVLYPTAERLSEQPLALLAKQHADCWLLPTEPYAPAVLDKKRVEGFVNQRKLWSLTRLSVENAAKATGLEPTLTFILWLDCYFQSPLMPAWMVDKLFPYPWSGILFHPAQTQLNLEGMTTKERLVATAFNLQPPPPMTPPVYSRNLKALAMLDEFFVREYAHIAPQVDFLHFPDVATSTTAEDGFPLLQEITKRAAGRTIVTLAGSLESRKGLMTLARVAQRAAQEEFFFVFCGKLYPESFDDHARMFQAFIDSEPQNCYFHLEYIPDERQFNSILALSDILFAAYVDFKSSSNLVSKAAILRKPILVSDKHVMGETVMRYNLGRVAPQKDTATTLLALQELRVADLEGFGFTAFAEDNSPAKLEKELCALLERYQ
ncbi:MAG: glycosyltransferase family 4 protein [Okeania sp. SIO3B3]|nr:glycosyltransferase family 4 protein [Okeania sp. SIO3B3]